MAFMELSYFVLRAHLLAILIEMPHFHADRIGHEIRILRTIPANRPLVGDVLAGCALPGAAPLVVVSFVSAGLR
jgi:hypothetical protein